MKNNRGITLIALIITIIVLLILAGVSISMVVGENGIMNKAGKASEETKKADSRERVELEVVGSYDNSGKINLKELNENLRTHLDKVEFEKIRDSGNYISLTQTDEITELPVRVKYNGEIVDITGSKSIEVKEDETKANKPEITTGMIPVKYDTEIEKWVICSVNDPEWYSYTEQDKKWANVMLSDGTYKNETAVEGQVVEEADLGSMFVWIPRYAYKITKGYHSNTEGRIEVVFLDGTSYDYVDSEGNKKKARNGNEPGVIINEKPDGEVKEGENYGYTDYVVHPAFTDGNKNNEMSNGERENFSNGEWRKEIKGIWVAKFDAGIYTTDKDINKKVTVQTDTEETTAEYYYPVFKGRKYGYNFVNVSTCYQLSQALDDTSNPYGLTSSANSHLLKNSEWGAVAYLSISKYGYSNGVATESTEKYKNNLSIVNGVIKNPNLNDSYYPIMSLTGYSSGKAGKNTKNNVSISSEVDLNDTLTGTDGDSYVWNTVNSKSTSGVGTTSSTTGNIYGVYDMGGCTGNRTAAYVYGNRDGEVSEDLTKRCTFFNNEKSNYLVTVYPFPTKEEFELNEMWENLQNVHTAYPKFSKIFGDAIWDTSGNTGECNAWFRQTADENDVDGELFFAMGGDYRNYNNAGLCGFYDIHSMAMEWYGFRSVLILEN